MSDHYDFIIIGSGAGGGTPLNKLAPSGERTLLAMAWASGLLNARQRLGLCRCSRAFRRGAILSVGEHSFHRSRNKAAQ